MIRRLGFVLSASALVMCVETVFPPSALVPGVETFGGIAANDATIFWISSGAVQSFPVDELGAVVMISSSHPQTVKADSAGAYWVGTGEVEWTTGGATTTSTSGYIGGSCLTTDASSIYVGDLNGVSKLAKDGSGVIALATFSVRGCGGIGVNSVDSLLDERSTRFRWR